MPGDKFVNVESVGAVAIVEQATVGIKNSSFLHVDAARCLVRDSIGIQKNYDQNADDEAKNTQKSTYRACVLGALFTSVAFFEASINEVFLDAVDCMPENARKKNDTRVNVPVSQVGSYRDGALSSDVVKTMAQMWLQQQKVKSDLHDLPRLVPQLSGSYPNNIEKYWSAIDKYQLALFLNEKRPICKCNKKRKDVQTLIDFRNDLIHYKPGWSLSVPGGGALEPVDDKIAKTKSRVGTLIKSDTHRPPGGYPHEKELLDSAYPNSCLSAAFAKLALQSILQFDDEFSKRMRIDNAVTKFGLQQKMSEIPSLEGDTEGGTDYKVRCETTLERRL